jgi:hypothetical protein
LSHRHTTLSLAQDRKYLRLTKSRLFHKNLLDQNAEKILLINPLNFRGDYLTKVRDPSDIHAWLTKEAGKGHLQLELWYGRGAAITTNCPAFAAEYI